MRLVFFFFFNRAGTTNSIQLNVSVRLELLYLYGLRTRDSVATFNENGSRGRHRDGDTVNFDISDCVVLDV